VPLHRALAGRPTARDHAKPSYQGGVTLSGSETAPDQGILLPAVSVGLFTPDRTQPQRDIGRVDDRSTHGVTRNPGWADQAPPGLPEAGWSGAE